jgi:hypothetical protein
MKKPALYILALIAILGALLLINLGGAAKKAIEAVGSQTLGTPVRVSGINVSLRNKSAAMSGLSIQNPQGFKSTYLLQTKGISVKIADASQKVVTIDEIIVDGMTVAYELGSKGTNFDIIRQNMNSAGGGTSDANTSKVIIRRLKIINGQLIPAIGAAHAPIPLPTITLNNIGSSNNPATPAQVAAQLLTKILAVSSASAIKAGLSVPFGDSLKAVGGLVNVLFSK